MSASLAYLGGGDIGFFVSLGIVTYVIFKAFRTKPDRSTFAGYEVLASSPEGMVRFDPLLDHRTSRGIKWNKIVLTPTTTEARVVESITLNNDFVAVGRGAAGVQTILLDEQTVIRLNIGALPHYAETQYHMVLSRGAEAAQVPVSFRGWMGFFDACRRAGGTLEVADEVSDQMRVTVLGQRGAGRLKLSDVPASPKVSRPTSCPTCGALLGKRGPCEYCGANV